jgi:hypothetical protein
MSFYEYPFALEIEEYVLTDPNKNQTRPFSDETTIETTMSWVVTIFNQWNMRNLQKSRDSRRIP